MESNRQTHQLPENFIRYQEIIHQALKPALMLEPRELNLLSHYQMGWVDENGNNSSGFFSFSNTFL